jgi:hypothetical protein
LVVPEEFGVTKDASWRVPPPVGPVEVGRAKLQHDLGCALREEPDLEDALDRAARLLGTERSLLTRKLNGQLPITIEDLVALCKTVGVQILPETIDATTFTPRELLGRTIPAA